MWQPFRLILLGLTLCGILPACTPQFVGPTTAGYYVAVIYDTAIYLPDPAQLMVRVQNAQRQPLDGIPVTFQVEPSWADQASVTPPRVLTKQGIARALFQPETTGLARVIITVDGMFKKIQIIISPRPSPPSGV